MKATRRESHVVTLNYYTPAMRHYAWCKMARASGKKLLLLQLFLDDPTSSIGATLFTVGVSLAIIAQVITMMLRSGSFDVERTDSLVDGLNTTDMVLTILFTVEIILYGISRAEWKDLLVQYLWWIDIIAVLPFYIDKSYEGITGEHIGPEILGLLRTLRILRLIKVSKHNSDLQILWHVLLVSMRALLLPLTLLFVGAFFLGFLVFYAELLELGESEDNKDGVNETAFTDVGNAVWFMIVTFTTVGYGDVTVTSHVGKLITVIAIVMGVVFVAMPLAIVGSNFTLAWDEKMKLSVVEQVQMHCIDTSISLNGVQRLFIEADQDLSGVLDYAEFRGFMMNLGVRMTPSQARKVFHVFDESGNGDISFFEFCHCLFPDLDIEQAAETGVICSMGEEYKEGHPVHPHETTRDLSMPSWEGHHGTAIQSSSPDNTPDGSHEKDRQSDTGKEDGHGGHGHITPMSQENSVSPIVDRLPAVLRHELHSLVRPVDDKDHARHRSAPHPSPHPSLPSSSTTGGGNGNGPVEGPSRGWTSEAPTESFSAKDLPQTMERMARHLESISAHMARLEARFDKLEAIGSFE